VCEATKVLSRTAEPRRTERRGKDHHHAKSPVPPGDMVGHLYVIAYKYYSSFEYNFTDMLVSSVLLVAINNNYNS
jgi:hypothetical protein